MKRTRCQDRGTRGRLPPADKYATEIYKPLCVNANDATDRLHVCRSMGLPVKAHARATPIQVTAAAAAIHMA